MTNISRYFDYAAASPLDPGVLEQMKPYFTDDFYNPSALYSGGSTAKKALDEARSRVAEVLGVKPKEIIFTSGCSEANNLAIQGVMNQFPGKKLLISAIEHDSVIKPAEHYDHAILPVDNTGLISVDTLKSMITDETVLVSIVYANNEIGTIQPLREISKLIASVRKLRGPNGLPIYFHTDAAQAPNYLDIHPHGLGVDLMSLNGAKCYGPKGSGCLYVAKNVHVEPIIFGGGQESGMRSGTENIPCIVGFALALGRASLSSQDEFERLLNIKDQLELGLIKLGGLINSKAKHRLPNIVSVTFPGFDNERLVYKLDELGFMVSSGSACHARTGELSRVLTAIGLGNNHAKSTIRISTGRYTTSESVNDLLKTISQLLALA